MFLQPFSKNNQKVSYYLQIRRLCKSMSERSCFGWADCGRAGRRGRASSLSCPASITTRRSAWSNCLYIYIAVVISAGGPQNRHIRRAAPGDSVQGLRHRHGRRGHLLQSLKPNDGKHIYLACRDLFFIRVLMALVESKLFKLIRTHIYIYIYIRTHIYIYISEISRLM